VTKNSQKGHFQNRGEKIALPGRSGGGGVGGAQKKVTKKEKILGFNQQCDEEVGNFLTLGEG